MQQNFFKKFQIQREKMLARESLFEVELQKQDSLDEELYSILVRQARYRGGIKSNKNSVTEAWLWVFDENWGISYALDMRSSEFSKLGKARVAKIQT